ncbi:hypothetical protein M7I_1131 [Glarea lozoyensis 74030]|uniref:Uncharacterized protein n=1 Tax=Glarea lozoyensis (strain ATCC 74030 / MF5533) TaxID=1104152 RepID=H0EF90_GLAL7|nr:hypothetical protein M7I_1131 [Glarea lozoyensis 74030]
MTSARDFFKDLQATYIFLQNHQDTAKTTFNSHLHGLPLFLNTNSLNGQAYQELIDEEELQILEEGDEVDNYQKLLSLLEIHKAANYQIIMPLAEYIEYMILLAIKIVINIDNVDTIREKAGLAQAEKVEQFCVSFYEANKDTLRFKGE